MIINPLTAIDFYKADHRRQYPEGTTEVYSNFTPRSVHESAPMCFHISNGVIFFGLQYFIKHFLIDAWNFKFFYKPKSAVVASYKKIMDESLGENAIDVKHIEELHDLGYLPIKIKALPEGSFVPVGVPVLTIVNTHPDFAWLTNYIESVMSCMLWKPITSATIAFHYRKLLQKLSDVTGSIEDFYRFQAHDFSFRGMSGLQDAAMSGAAHLTSFVGTDSVPAIELLQEYYGGSTGLIGCSVPATEHSVMCMGGQDRELETFRRLITQTYPNGIVSIVSDTWDFWKVITEYLPLLKDEIMARNGKVVIRPDSGDPVKIICGDGDAPKRSPELKGAIHALWEIFGGTVNDKGYKVLDSHIGLIYGDSITIDRAVDILSRLEARGFSSDNIVFGIGSYTYQYCTRDTFGLAMKATSGVVNGERRDIFKNPKTDDGRKKSAKGLLTVTKENGRYVLHDNQCVASESLGELKEVFMDGKLTLETSLDEIRASIDAEVANET